MKSEKHNDQNDIAGLYSGGILRAVVQALDIENDELRNRTARRFFAGESVDEYSRNWFSKPWGRL